MYRAVVVAFLLASSSVLAAAPPASVYALPEADFLQQADADFGVLLRNAQGFRALARELERLRPLLTRKDEATYTPDEKRQILTFWASFFDHFVATELIRQRYWDFLLQPPNGKVHVWGFLATHTSLTLELAHGLAFCELTAGRAQLEVLLDESSTEYGVPRRAFAQLKDRVIHAGTSTQLMTGDAYEMQLRVRYKGAGILDSVNARRAVQTMREHSKLAKKKMSRKGLSLFAKAGLDVAKDGVGRAVFPVQKGVAEWMGDTRVHRKGQPLISRALVLELLEKMAPGDIIVARQNWYLSNIGLPGFWPHAELHVGTPDQLATAFDEDAEVKAWLSTLPGKPATFTAYLAGHHPKKWGEYRGKDEHGDPLRIIEAISEGVSFTGLEHGMRVDYVAVMRPRLSKVEKAKAIARAFAYQGRPYDFDFDFYSDATLVCTELVYKAYAPSKDMKGLTLPLVKVAGRMTLPANEIVRMFAEQRGDDAQQLDFVGFIDGREDTRSAVASDEAAFAESHRRMKWDVAQK